MSDQICFSDPSRLYAAAQPGVQNVAQGVAQQVYRKDD
jgi:hypothetical protein